MSKIKIKLIFLVNLLFLIFFNSILQAESKFFIVTKTKFCGASKTEPQIEIISDFLYDVLSMLMLICSENEGPKLDKTKIPKINPNKQISFNITFVTILLNI